jgi:hypothetical protein
VESVVQLVAHEPKVENADSAENVPRVRRGSVLQEVSDRPRAVREHRAHHVHKGSVLLARRGNGQLDPGELEALLRKLQ